MEASEASSDALSQDLRDALLQLSSPLVGDCLERLSGIVGLHRFHVSRKLVGIARTVKTRTGDNLFVYRALHALRPGEVLVVDAGGGLDNAIVGELILLYAASRGCEGFVIDGAIRDREAFAAADFPCYARGVSLKGPFKTGPGRLDVPVSVGGQVISPGDVVLGDEDGVIAFPAAEAAMIVAAAEARARAEDDIRRQIAAGDERWIATYVPPVASASVQP